MSNAMLGWLLIIALSLIAYFGVPALVVAFVRITAEARLRNERRLEDLDEVARGDLLETVSQERIDEKP